MQLNTWSTFELLFLSTGICYQLSCLRVHIPEVSLCFSLPLILTYIFMRGYLNKAWGRGRVEKVKHQALRLLKWALPSPDARLQVPHGSTSSGSHCSSSLPFSHLEMPNLQPECHPHGVTIKIINLQPECHPHGEALPKLWLTQVSITRIHDLNFSFVALII